MSLILAEEEEAGPGRAPAAIIEELYPGVYGQQGALHHVIRPDPGRPGVCTSCDVSIQ